MFSYINFLKLKKQKGKEFKKWCYQYKISRQLIFSENVLHE